MIIDHVERYIIERHKCGLRVRMRQGRQAVLLCGISLSVLLPSWWFGPQGPQPSAFWAPPPHFYWIWIGFFSLLVVLSLAGAGYRQNFLFAEQEITISQWWGPWSSSRCIPIGPVPVVCIEVLPMGTSTGRALFPFRLHLLDDERKLSGVLLEFQVSGSVDRFLQVLRRVYNLEVEDKRTGKRKAS